MKLEIINISSQFVAHFWPFSAENVFCAADAARKLVLSQGQAGASGDVNSGPLPLSEIHNQQFGFRHFFDRVA